MYSSNTQDHLTKHHFTAMNIFPVVNFFAMFFLPLMYCQPTVGPEQKYIKTDNCNYDGLRELKHQYEYILSKTTFSMSKLEQKAQLLKLRGKANLFRYYNSFKYLEMTNNSHGSKLILHYIS